MKSHPDVLIRGRSFFQNTTVTNGDKTASLGTITTNVECCSETYISEVFSFCLLKVNRKSCNVVTTLIKKNWFPGINSSGVAIQITAVEHFLYVSVMFVFPCFLKLKHLSSLFLSTLVR